MPSETVDTSPQSTDRRTRKREQRREYLLDLAAELVEESGVSGVTISALADRADYAPASLYTYFPSHSALVAALQSRALRRLAAVAVAHVESWDTALGVADVEGDLLPLDAAARLWAFAELFLTAPSHHARDFRLQQELLGSPDVEMPDDAADVVPVAMAVLDVPRRLLADARTSGLLDDADNPLDPLGNPIDIDIHRTLAWVVAMNGALLVDGLATGIASTGRDLGREITGAFLRGWGAPPDIVVKASALASTLAPPSSDPEPERPHR